MNRFRPRLTYANVIASLALFVALGGSAVAAGLAKNSVGPNQLKKGAVQANKIAKQAVTSGKIAPKAVTAGKLGPNAVLPGNLGAGIIDSSKIAASAVTAEKIKNNVVTTNKITNGAVNTQKIAANGVATTNLAEKAVTTAKLNEGAVTAAKLAPGVLGNVENLKAGQTERGVFSLGGTKAEGDETSAFGAISFQQILAANPAATVIVPKAGPFTTQCPGLGGGGTTPEAVGGVVCVYVSTTEENIESLTASTSRLGVTLTAKGTKTAKGNFVASGVWAVTAP
jgi:trimeric autotransporter adhesin